MKLPVTYRRKVRYSDTDAQGHVFNVNYFTYFDDAITDYREVAEGIAGVDSRYEIVLARAESDFLSSAKLGEKLATTVTVERVGNTSITFALEVVKEESGKVVVKGKEIYVVVSSETMRPIAVPPPLRAAIDKLSG